jgi:hypothetical protein
LTPVIKGHAAPSAVVSRPVIGCSTMAAKSISGPGMATMSLCSDTTISTVSRTPWDYAKYGFPGSAECINKRSILTSKSESADTTIKIFT